MAINGKEHATETPTLLHAETGNARRAPYKVTSPVPPEQREMILRGAGLPRDIVAHGRTPEGNIGYAGNGTCTTNQAIVSAIQFGLESVVVFREKGGKLEDIEPADEFPGVFVEGNSEAANQLIEKIYNQRTTVAQVPKEAEEFARNIREADPRLASFPPSANLASSGEKSKPEDVEDEGVRLVNLWKQHQCPDPLDIEQAAAVMRCSPKNVERKERDKEIKRVGKIKGKKSRRLYSTDSVMRFMEHKRDKK